MFNYVRKKTTNIQVNVPFSIKFSNENIVLLNNTRKTEICKIPLDVIIKAYFADPNRIPQLIKMYIPAYVSYSQDDWDTLLDTISNHIDSVA